MRLTDGIESSHWERQRSQPKITIAYYQIHKHTCHGAHRDEGTQILKVRKGCLGEVHSTLRPEEKELELSGWSKGGSFLRHWKGKCWRWAKLSYSRTYRGMAFTQIPHLYSLSPLLLKYTTSPRFVLWYPPYFFPSNLLKDFSLEISLFPSVLSIHPSLKSFHPLHVPYITYQKIKEKKISVNRHAKEFHVLSWD